MKKLNKIFEEVIHDEYTSAIINELIEGRYEIVKHSLISDSYSRYLVYLKYDNGYLGITCQVHLKDLEDKKHDDYGLPNPIKIINIDMLGSVLVLGKNFKKVSEMASGLLNSVFKKYLINDIAKYLQPIVTKDIGYSDARDDDDDYNRREMDNQYQNTPDSHDWADDANYGRDKDRDMDKFQKSINNKPKSTDADDIEYYSKFQDFK